MTVLVSTFHRIAVFSVSVLHDERIVIVAEQRPDSTEEDSFQWMSRVLQVQSLNLQSAESDQKLGAVRGVTYPHLPHSFLDA